MAVVYRCCPMSWSRRRVGRRALGRRGLGGDGRGCGDSRLDIGRRCRVGLCGRALGRSAGCGRSCRGLGRCLGGRGIGGGAAVGVVVSVAVASVAEAAWPPRSSLPRRWIDRRPGRMAAATVAIAVAAIDSGGAVPVDVVAGGRRGAGDRRGDGNGDGNGVRRGRYPSALSSAVVPLDSVELASLEVDFVVDRRVAARRSAGFGRARRRSAHCVGGGASVRIVGGRRCPELLSFWRSGCCELLLACWFDAASSGAGWCRYCCSTAGPPAAGPMALLACCCRPASRKCRCCPAMDRTGPGSLAAARSEKSTLVAASDVTLYTGGLSR